MFHPDWNKVLKTEKTEYDLWHVMLKASKPQYSIDFLDWPGRWQFLWALDDKLACSMLNMGHAINYDEEFPILH